MQYFIKSSKRDVPTTFLTSNSRPLNSYALNFLEHPHKILKLSNYKNICVRRKERKRYLLLKLIYGRLSDTKHTC